MIRRVSLIKKCFYWLRTIKILLAATIPVITGFISTGFVWWKEIVSVAGAAVAIIAPITGLFRFQENWVEYRTNSESLEHEKYLFLT
ncbi:DUF4231 domain-containing protein [Metallumcola ferriviriculae]|uniref:DUF4231 domain-containing protein n=1 Tax=Metallumcola ferriviriculae TaxID=3039180 RepID=A0AAU0UGW2_9FIRM|nr:DUF4231 domain-containing protein [Desulfitibacteraceae bacterium MK1]